MGKIDSAGFQSNSKGHKDMAHSQYIERWAHIGFYVIVATIQSCAAVAASNIGQDPILPNRPMIFAGDAGVALPFAV